MSEMAIESVKAQCQTLVETAAVFERTHTRMTDMERDAVKASRSLLIAIEALEQYPDTNRKITALSKIAAAFR